VVYAAQVNAVMSDAAASDDSDLRTIVHCGTPLVATARSYNPDDPLCRFVVAALTAIGQQRSAAEVSEVLRGRRRKL
jgi:hypothetical protein